MNLNFLTKLIIVELFLVMVQFWLGMSSNLFINIPLGSPFGFFAYSGGSEVLAHIINGSLIVAFGFAIVWFTYKTKNLTALKLSVLAVAFTISAVVNGVTFLKIFSVPALYSIDNDFSMGMAMSFLAVFTLLFTELYVIKKNA
jgi:ABC-type sulfate transport system permease subunit